MKQITLKHVEKVFRSFFGLITPNITKKTSGLNKVYIEETNGIVLKIHTDNNLQKIKNEVEFSSILQKKNIFCNRPIEINGRSIFKHFGFYITFWHYISHSEKPTNWYNFGVALQKFHQATTGYRSTNDNKVTRIKRNIDKLDVDNTDPVLLRRLQSLFTSYAGQYNQIENHLQGGLCHGDIHEGNIITDKKGVIHLIDYELVNNSDYRLDLISTYFFLVVSKQNKDAYASFAKGYSEDVSAWEYFELFLNIIKLSSCIWMAKYYAENPSRRIYTELNNRVEALELNKSIAFNSIF